MVEVSPISFFCSVTKGPLPTREIYAFVTPTIRSIFLGPTPEPIAALPEDVFELVTNGYVP